MELNLINVATRETRIIDDPANPGERVKLMGWWDRVSGSFLGETRGEAEDIYAIKYGYRHVSQSDCIIWTRKHQQACRPQGGHS